MARFRRPIFEQILSGELFLGKHERELRHFIEETAEAHVHEILQRIVSQLEVDRHAFFLSLLPNAKRSLHAHQYIIEDAHQLPYLQLKHGHTQHHSYFVEQNREYDLQQQPDFTSSQYAQVYAERYHTTLPLMAQTLYDTTTEQIQPIYISLISAHDMLSTTSQARLLFVQDSEPISSNQQLRASFGQQRLNDFRVSFRPHSRSVVMTFRDESLSYQYLGPLRTSDQTTHQIFINYTEDHHRPQRAHATQDGHMEIAHGFQPQAAQELR